MKGKVFSVNISKTKGVAKKPVKEVVLIKDFGLEGDAHAAPGDKQVSLLAIESINGQNECPKVNPVRNSISNGVKKSGEALRPGDFAENITTEGINFLELNVGRKLEIGEEVILEISKIGKECHKYCAIYYKIGDCIMPREGVFAKVIIGGVIKTGDTIEAV